MVGSKKVDWIRRSNALKFRVRHFIEGRNVEGRGGALKKNGPRDGRMLYRFRGGNVQDVGEAVSSSRCAFEDGRWSKISVTNRVEIMRKFASLIEKHSHELALLECLDVGKPISDSVNIDIPMTVASINDAAEAADKLGSRVYGVDQSHLSYQLRRPRGVVAGLVGWNFPLVLAAAKIGPALAMGNSLVLKPSEVTSLATGRLGELAVEAGVPPGVLNIVNGDAGVGAILAHHCDVDMLTFTGSSATGKKMLIAAGKSNMKRLLLECGGKAPNIVFDDSPHLEAVAEAVVARAFWNQGQVCTASSRLLIQESIKDELLRIVIEKTSELKPGDPLRPETRFGALVSKSHLQRVNAFIKDAEREGTQIAYRSDSRPPVPGGFYASPVIFDNVRPEQQIAREEVFGPVLSVMGFRDDAEAIQIANDTIYGLSAVVWTKDVSRAHRVTQGIDAGWIVVNASDGQVPGTGGGPISVGGHKQSGIGVEGGVQGLEAYTTQTAVQYFL